MKENNKKYIDINKLIIIVLCFIVVLFLTIIINMITHFSSKKTTSYDSSNVYATGNRKQVTNNSNKVETTKHEEETKDEQTISYFEDVEEEVNTYANEGNTTKLSTVAKEKFVTLVDFIFYGTEIKGVTFNELKQDTKDKLVSIVNKIDDKIETKVPNYKEEIKDDASNVYSILSENLHKGITYVDDKIEEKVGTEKYDNFKSKVSETTEKAKDKAQDILASGKEVVSKAKDKIKKWYEGWK